jgi:hypothetical protein
VGAKTEKTDGQAPKKSDEKAGPKKS